MFNVVLSTTQHNAMVLEHNKGSETRMLCSLSRFWRVVLHSANVEVTNQTAFSLTIRRCCIFISIAIVISILIVWNHIGFFLDDILFAGWRHCEVESPLFIVGNARSGTTWLHRLITADSNRFTTMRTWEIIFAPSVTWRVLFRSIYCLDSLLSGGLLFKALMFLEERILGSPTARANSVHHVGLFEAEEDEFLMIHVGYAQLVLFFFPLASDLLHPLIMFDYTPESGPGSQPEDHLAQAVKATIFGYYRQCVQRHVYYHSQLRGGGRLIFVSKNPTFTLRIPSVYAAFPDARVVCLLRDPMQSVPSMVSYIAKVWIVFADPVNPYPNARQLLGFCVAHYMFPLRHLRPRLPRVHSGRPRAAAGGDSLKSGWGDSSTASSPSTDPEMSSARLSADGQDTPTSSKGTPPVAAALEGAEAAEGRDERQWAFVSYHHLREDLEDTVLHLLERLYGRRWYCSCRASTASAPGLVWEETSTAEGGAALPSPGACTCAGDLDAFRAALYCEQLNTSGFVPKHKHSVEMCCGGLTEAELKETLADVYSAHGDAFPQ